MGNIVKITEAKKKSKSHVGFLGLLLVVAIVCFFLLSPIFAIDNIEVEGNKTITKNYILSSSGILYGENILKMNKLKARERINSIPAIESTTIRRAWPNKIIITVDEKVPIGETKFYGSKLLISENGDVIKVVTDNTMSEVPTLEGITVKDVIAGKELICVEEEKLKKYLEVLKKLKENDMLNDVTGISDNNGILVSFNIGHMAFLGDIDNLQYKIDWLKGIWEKEENPAYIDLHNLDKVVTKPVWGVINNKASEEITDTANNNEQIRSEEVEE